MRLLAELRQSPSETLGTREEDSQQRVLVGGLGHEERVSQLIRIWLVLPGSPWTSGSPGSTWATRRSGKSSPTTPPPTPSLGSALNTSRSAKSWPFSLLSYFRVISESYPVTLSDRGCCQHLARETLGLEG